MQPTTDPLISVAQLHSPVLRAMFVIEMLNTRSREDLVEFDKIMGSPAVTPSQERINDVKDPIRQRALTMRNDRTGEILTYSYFEGIGCMLLYSSPKEGTNMWVDPMPGEGMRARRDYLENTLTLAYAKMGHKLDVYENGKPVERKAEAPVPSEDLN